MRTAAAAITATLLAAASTARAADVIDLRIGYWEAVWTIPGEATTREFVCVTPEDLEAMRFFAKAPEGCKTTRGTQSRRRYEATSVCVDEGERMTIRWALESPDPMRFDLRALYEIGGKTQPATAAYRWLQERCDAAGRIPNS